MEIRLPVRHVYPDSIVLERIGLVSRHQGAVVLPQPLQHARHGGVELGVFRLLLVEDVESLHHVEHAADEHHVLHEADQRAEDGVGQTELHTLQCLGKYVGHKSQHDGDDNPEEEKGHYAGEHVGLRTRYGEVFAKGAVTGGGNEQAGQKTYGGNDFFDKAVAPAVEGGPNHQDEDEKINHNAYEIGYFVRLVK